MDDRKAIENGIHTISSDEYHNSCGISRSALMEFKRSPFHYYYKYLCDSEPVEPTPALIEGSLIHTFVLEPETLYDNFVLKPVVDRRTNAGKLIHNQFQATIAGRMPISHEQLSRAEDIANAIKKHSLCPDLLMDCEIEKSIYFTHEPTGIQCKVRPDAWKNDVVIDLKTSNNAGSAYELSAYKYGYFLQAGMIAYALKTLGIELDKFINLVVEKEPPYAIGVYLYHPEAISYGLNQFHALMELLKQCQEKNTWPDYGVRILHVPHQANYETQMEIDIND